jgi:hypothetical protein
MKPVLLVSLIAFVAGCSSSTSPSGPLAGTWAGVYTLPGLSSTMTLESTGSVVLGSGQFCGEALRCGTLTVSGTADGNKIHLDIRYDNGGRLFFNGQVVSYTSIVGSGKWEMGIPESFAVSFKRI